MGNKLMMNFSEKNLYVKELHCGKVNISFSVAIFSKSTANGRALPCCAIKLRGNLSSLLELFLCKLVGVFSFILSLFLPSFTQFSTPYFYSRRRDSNDVSALLYLPSQLCRISYFLFCFTVFKTKEKIKLYTFGANYVQFVLPLLLCFAAADSENQHPRWDEMRNEKRHCLCLLVSASVSVCVCACACPHLIYIYAYTLLW